MRRGIHTAVKTLNSSEVIYRRSVASSFIAGRRKGGTCSKGFGNQEIDEPPAMWAAITDNALFN
jgi:hypothetical protein